jgi:hypothetical protein
VAIGGVCQTEDQPDAIDRKAVFPQEEEVEER